MPGCYRAPNTFGRADNGSEDWVRTNDELDRAEQPDEQIVLRIAMAEVLSKSLRECSTAFATSARAPILHRFNVIVHPVMLEEPIALAGVLGQHFGLDLNDRANVDAKGRRNLLTESIFAFDRIAIIQAWDSIQRLRIFAKIKRDR